MSEQSEPCQKCGDACYARMLNEASERKLYMEDEFCSVCKAHMSVKGICLNACHLDLESRNRFSDLFVRKS